MGKNTKHHLKKKKEKKKKKKKKKVQFKFIKQVSRNVCLLTFPYYKEVRKRKNLKDK